MAATTTPTIDLYIVIFILSLIFMKAIDFLGRIGYCLQKDDPKFQSMLGPEIRLEQFFKCYFCNYWVYVYVMKTVLCEGLLLYAAIMQCCYKLVIPWLVVTAIMLVGEIVHLVSSLTGRCKPGWRQLLFIGHLFYTFYYIYSWRPINCVS